MRKFGFIFFFIAAALALVVTNYFSPVLTHEPEPDITHAQDEHSRPSGTANIVRRMRDTEPFSAVNAGNGIQVNIVIGDVTQLAVEAAEDLQPLIGTEVREGTLFINADDVSSKAKIRVFITIPNLNAVSASGAAHITAEGVAADELLTLTADGAGQVKISGSANELKISSSGAAFVDAGDLTARAADVDSTGASRVSVNAAEMLAVEASGVSRVSYFGSPTDSKISRSGGAKVAKAE